MGGASSYVGVLAAVPPLGYSLRALGDARLIRGDEAKESPDGGGRGARTPRCEAMTGLRFLLSPLFCAAPMACILAVTSGLALDASSIFSASSSSSSGCVRFCVNVTRAEHPARRTSTTTELAAENRCSRAGSARANGVGHVSVTDAVVRRSESASAPSIHNSVMSL